MIKKYLKMIKEYLNRYNMSWKNALLIPTIIAFILSWLLYDAGGVHKINKLVDVKAQTRIEETNAEISKLQQENKTLSDYKTELNNTLLSKADYQTALSEYNANKESYSKQISSLTGKIESANKSIQQKQSELNRRKEEQAKREQEEKEEKERKEKEEKAEKERKIVEAEDQSEEMVWIGETGTKYHYKDCRTLKGNKYQITLKEAKAQGRGACKVCH